MVRAGEGWEGWRGGGTGPVLFLAGAPSPREILTLWKTEQAVRQGRSWGKKRRGRRRTRAQGEVGTLS